MAHDKRPPEALWPFLTQAGLDPIQKTVELDRWPLAAHFTANSAPPREVFLAEAGMNFTVVPHQPWFDHGRCFVDVAMPSLVGMSYWPFVQLAVARYQPDSLPQRELSPLVKAEMIQMLPERRLTVRRAGNDVFVKLEGQDVFGAFDVQNRWIAHLERFHGPQGMPAHAIELTALDETSGDIPFWEQVPNQTRFGRLGQELNLQIPAGNAGRFRLRLRELESIVGPNLTENEIGDLIVRTVYTDVVRLTE